MLPVEYVLPSGPATLTVGLVGASLNTIFTSAGALVTVDPCVGVVDTTVTCADAVGTHTPHFCRPGAVSLQHYERTDLRAQHENRRPTRGRSVEQVGDAVAQAINLGTQGRDIRSGAQHLT